MLAYRMGSLTTNKQIRVNESGPKAAIFFFSGGIYSTRSRIMIYHKFMFLPNLHYVNHSLSEHKDPASGSVACHITTKQKLKSSCSDFKHCTSSSICSNPHIQGMDF